MLRELDAAIEKRIPMVLVHEADPSHGGAPLDVLRADCVASGRDAEKIFANPIVRWQRIQDFHVLSLRLIAAHVLHTMPQFRASPTPPPGAVQQGTAKPRRSSTGARSTATLTRRPFPSLHTQYMCRASSRSRSSHSKRLSSCT